MLVFILLACHTSGLPCDVFIFIGIIDAVSHVSVSFGAMVSNGVFKSRGGLSYGHMLITWLTFTDKIIPTCKTL